MPGNENDFVAKDTYCDKRGLIATFFLLQYSGILLVTAPHRINSPFLSSSSSWDHHRYRRGRRTRPLLDRLLRVFLAEDHAAVDLEVQSYFQYPIMLDIMSNPVTLPLVWPTNATPCIIIVASARRKRHDGDVPTHEAACRTGMRAHAEPYALLPASYSHSARSI